MMDIFDRLAGAQIFSVLDLKKSFMQIPVHPNSVHKTAVTTPIGAYKFLKLPFGVRGAS